MRTFLRTAMHPFSQAPEVSPALNGEPPVTPVTLPDLPNENYTEAFRLATLSVAQEQQHQCHPELTSNAKSPGLSGRTRSFFLYHILEAKTECWLGSSLP